MRLPLLLCCCVGLRQPSPQSQIVFARVRCCPRDYARPHDSIAVLRRRPTVARLTAGSWAAFHLSGRDCRNSIKRTNCSFVSRSANVNRKGIFDGSGNWSGSSRENCSCSQASQIADSARCRAPAVDTSRSHAKSFIVLAVFRCPMHPPANTILNGLRLLMQPRQSCHPRTLRLPCRTVERVKPVVCFHLLKKHNTPRG